MFKPQKKEEPAPAASPKVRLPLLPAMPTVKQMRAQLDEARLRRAAVGTIIEQQWSGGRPGQTFNLMVSWDKAAEYPVWTLYEEGGSEESKMHWSQPFNPADVDMLFDIMAMSCETTSASKIPDSLRPKEDLLADVPGNSSSLSAPKSSAPAQPQPTPARAPEPPPAPAPAPQPNYPPAQQQWQQPQPGYPPQYPGGYPPPYQAPGGYGYGAYPPPNPSGYPQPAPNPVAYPQPQAAPAQGSFWNTAQPAAPARSESSGSIPQELRVEKGGLSSDYNNVTRRANILLGTLLFEGGFINHTTLDAALKIQEMVREEKLSVGDAPEALKRLHSMGGSIDQYMQNAGASTAAPANRSANSNAEVAEQRAAFDLLQKAGLLKEEDIKSASQVRSKHGGDMVQILQAANKLDATTYKAASTCVPLIRDNKMKAEQCIIALNYCSRSRVDFETALDELGWPNPLK